MLLLLSFRRSDTSYFAPCSAGAVAGGTAAAAGGASAAPGLLPSAEAPTPEGPPTADEVALRLVARAAVQAGQLTQSDADALHEQLRQCDGAAARGRAAAQLLSAPPFFAPFRRVVVHGLVSRATLNGLGAQVQQSGMRLGRDGGARIPITVIGGPSGMVQCRDSGDPPNEQLLVRPANLRLIPWDGMSYDDELRLVREVDVTNR